MKFDLIKPMFIIFFISLLIYTISLLVVPADTNLIANPGFESGSTEPVNWTFVTNNGNTPIWDKIHHNGTRSIKISISGTTSRESGYPKSDLIKAEPLRYYTFSAWVKTENAGETSEPAVRIVELDVNKSWIRQTSLVFSQGMNEWTQKRIDFQTDSNTAYLYVYTNIWRGSGTFWVDDIELSIKTTQTIPPTPSPPRISSPAYYVAMNGNDDNPGTETRPWRTITKAANKVVAGDTVYIKEGIYNEKITIKNSGTQGNYITIAAYPGHTVTIDGTGIVVPYWDGLVRIYGASYVKLSGLRIINSRFMGVMVTSDYGTNFPSNIIIERNNISNTASSAILIEDGKNVIIDGNEITKAQTREGLKQRHIGQETISLVNVEGFEIKNNKLYNNNFESINVKEGSRNGRVYGNDISQHQSAGIYIDAWSRTSQDIEIFSNWIHDGTAKGARGIALAVENGGSLKNVKVYNNVIYNNAATGMDVSWYSNGTVDNILIAGNTIYNNGLVDSWGGGISVDYDPATNIIIRNNIVSKNNHYSIQVKDADAVIDCNLIDGYTGRQYETKGSNYVEGDPQFVNPANADFHLKSTSPAIDIGSSASVLAVDFDGRSRPQGGGYDIGAFEYSP